MLLPSGRWRVIDGPNVGLVFDRPVWVGAVDNRHGDMRCDWYVWDGLVDVYGNDAVSGTVNRVHPFCQSFPGVTCVHFRYTGRTEITLAVVSAFQAHNVEVKVEFWNQKTRTYQVLELP
jgi:hypothetical protein